MFLNKLNYSEKKMFLNLSILAAKANDVFTYEEKALLDEYCKEMDITDVDYSSVESIENITAFFSRSEDQIKKIVILELYGLVFADGSFDDCETDFVKNFTREIGVSDEICDNLISTLSEYYDVCRKLTNLIV